ncbi:MAG TPA: hypothetical protein VFH68_02790 [Polyangia bacterium]|jgi:hypothetical protein|nr:hypothetical protein [Polyangia bacterium]
MPRLATTTAMTTTRRWLIWLPVVMVASLLYWTVALGLGGMSLMAVSALSGSDGAGGFAIGATSGSDTDTAQATAPRDGYEPIIVHLEESVEPEDVDDNPGCGLSPGDDGSSRDQAEQPANQPWVRGLVVE